MTFEQMMTRLEDAVFSHAPEQLSQAFNRLDTDAYAPEEILTALGRGIDKARKRFRAGTYSIPEFLLAIDAYRSGVQRMKACLPPEHVDSLTGQHTHIVIGVVEGDVHDMGKNIVAAVMEACGYRVRDVGKNVSNDVFLEALAETHADVLALSTMMSTTLENMQALVRMVKRLFPSTAIIVGGAPFDADLVQKIGADGYAENAIAIPGETRRLLDLSGPAKCDDHSLQAKENT